MPWGTEEPTIRDCWTGGLLAEVGWGRMGVAAVRMPELDVRTALGMKAEIIPDWLLTGNIWQMI